MKRPIGAHVNTQMSEDIQLAAAVAEVGMILNHSELKGTSNYESVIQLFQPFDNTMSEYSRAEFLTMVEEMPKLITFSEEQKNINDARMKQEEELQKQRDEFRKQQIERYGGIPDIRLKMPQANGSLHKVIVQKVAKMHQKEIQACYEKELIKKTGISGQLIVNWVITPRGTVEQIKIKESTLNNKNVEKCIVDVLKSWKYPTPKDGGSVSVEFPFIFIFEKAE